MGAAKAGQDDAMHQLLDRHYDRLYAICLRIMGNQHDAADACQEALLLLVRKISQFDERAKFSTWSHRVATNAALDELRRKHRRPVSGSDTIDSILEDSPAFDRLVAERMTIDDALLHIPENFRVPVVMRDLVGMDYAEIGETLGIPAGTVRSRIARGRAQLATALGNSDDPNQRQS